MYQRDKPSSKQIDSNPIVPKESNELWEVDITGPLPVSEQEYKLILTMVDHYFKWSEIVPLESKDMANIMSAIESRLLKNTGCQRLFCLTMERNLKIG